MGKAVLAALLAFAAVVAATSPALAQGTSAQGGQFAPQEGSEAPRDEGSLYRGAYEVTEDGAVVEPLTREAVELCAEAGFPPVGAVLEDPASSSASAGPNEGRPDDALPGTGGPDPLALILAAVASSAAGAALTLRAER